MNTFSARIDGLMMKLYELQDAERLQVLTENLQPKPNAELVREADERIGLPPLLRAIYAEFDGLEIEWEASGARGRLKIPSVERWMADWQDSLWFEGEPSELPARQLRPLDQFSPEWWAVTRAGEDAVYLHEAGVRDLHPTGLTTTEWFELALGARFFDGWLFAFATHLTGAKEMEAALARDLTPLFPEFDAAPYTARSTAEPIAVR